MLEENNKSDKSDFLSINPLTGKPNYRYSCNPKKGTKLENFNNYLELLKGLDSKRSLLTDNIQTIEIALREAVKDDESMTKRLEELMKEIYSNNFATITAIEIDLTRQIDLDQEIECDGGDAIYEAQLDRSDRIRLQEASKAPKESNI